MQPQVVIPGKGLTFQGGLISFGMTQEQVEAAVGGRLPHPPELLPAMEGVYDGGSHFEFDSGGGLAFIHVFWDAWSRPAVRVLDIEDVFALPADDAVRALSRHAPPVVEGVGESVAFNDIRLGLWRPILPEDGEPDDEYRGGLYWMGISAWAPGYPREKDDLPPPATGS